MAVIYLCDVTSEIIGELLDEKKVLFMVKSYISFSYIIIDALNT